MYHWQDFVLAISILGFNIALIPSIVSKHKPHVSTGVLTVIFQLSAFVVFVSLSLWYSAAMSFLNAILWTVLVIQKLTDSKAMKQPQRGSAVLKVILILIILSVVGFGTWYVYQSSQDGTNVHQKNPGTPQNGSPKSKPTVKPVTYQNGKVVPVSSQARAKVAGYYCPSWDAKPGENSTDICVSLDK